MSAVSSVFGDTLNSAIHTEEICHYRSTDRGGISELNAESGGQCGDPKYTSSLSGVGAKIISCQKCSYLQYACNLVSRPMMGLFTVRRGTLTADLTDSRLGSELCLQTGSEDKKPKNSTLPTLQAL